MAGVVKAPTHEEVVADRAANGQPAQRVAARSAERDAAAAAINPQIAYFKALTDARTDSEFTQAAHDAQLARAHTDLDDADEAKANHMLGEAGAASRLVEGGRALRTLKDLGESVPPNRAQAKQKLERLLHDKDFRERLMAKDADATAKWDAYKFLAAYGKEETGD